MLTASRADSLPGTGRRPGLAGWTLIGATILYAGVLLLGPLIGIVWGSFSAGLGRFISVISASEALNALRLTVLLSLAATLINTLFGVPLALVMARHRFRGRAIVNALIDAPFAVSPVVAGLMLILLFGRGGAFTPIIDRLGVKVLFAWPAMLMATVFVSLPFVAREIIPVLGQIGTEQENAGYTLGANRRQVFRRITLPAIQWAVLYGVALTFARAMGEFGALVVVSGGVTGLTETSTLFIFRSLDDRNYVAAYAMSLVLAVLSFSIVAMMERFKKASMSGRSAG